ncbi:hypothetical protein ACHAXM_011325 [Skeletonema potamos]
MSFGRSDGRGYKSPSAPSDSMSVMGSGLAIAIAANRPDPNGGENRASRRASTDDDIEHLRVKAASADLQKKNTELLLRSEQQKNIRLNAALKELQTAHKNLSATLCTQREQNSRHIQAATKAVIALDEQRKENEETNARLSCQNNQLVQTALKLEKQRKETEKLQDTAKKTADENARLNQLISKKENQLVQKALEIERLTTETNHARRTLHDLARDNANLKKENEALLSKGEELSIEFAQSKIKYRTLETKHNAVEAQAKELSMINADLQSSTDTLQTAFGENVQALDTLSAENAELKSKLHSMTTNDSGNNTRTMPELIMAKLQHRRELLSLVKAARAAAEMKAHAISDEDEEEPTAEKVQARWESFVQHNDSIVTVLRGGEWVEAIALKKEDSSCFWVQYCCDGVTQAVSKDKICQQKRSKPSYYESPPTPKGKKYKKERSFYIGVA